MKLGILFPVVIFIVAVVFLGWFFVGGYAAPGGAWWKRQPSLWLLSPSWWSPAPNWAGGNLKFSRRPGIAELSYLLNNLRRYTHFISRFAVFMQQSGH